ncbi:acyltransferase [Conyzicola nivalis]|uniref:Acetylglucosamine-1-phosphate uridylyltransferase n=1 Tax=Conyzicola nivalis TaxID=1477021 RepID=A0A916SPG1_9MICO|nr:acyltransferase [Conyzicola nivalis]GGB10223.1 acetylglucosamine-1-phosphate uridylyltransferase [Conyzicola nivalis]
MTGVEEHRVMHDDELPARIATTADVDPRAKVGPDSLVWHLAQIREYAQISSGCIVGRGVYIGPGVIVGRNCKIQNYALIYEPALLEDGVFVGPAVVFTNDSYPRAINLDGSRQTNDDWEAVGVTVRTGASIGARAVCVAPITIGRYALVAAGSVVTKNVPDFAVVVGVPARQTGWVGRAGLPLVPTDDGGFVCPRTGERYVEHEGVLSPR